jgi:hypothetical protein
MSLTDTQLVLLSAAAQREEGLITMPERLKGAAAKAVVSKLLTQSLVEEVAVGRDAPSWCTDEEGTAFGLKITPAGLAAIGIEPEDGAEAGEMRRSDAVLTRVLDLANRGTSCRSADLAKVEQNLLGVLAFVRGLRTAGGTVTGTE